MIILQKDGLRMEVCTEVQASVFERNGYKRVDVCKPAETPISPKVVVEPAVETVVETVEEPAPIESKRKGRKPKA